MTLYTINGEQVKMPTRFKVAFDRMIALRGWTAQQAYDHVLRHPKKWDMLRRYNNALIRRAILEDPRLGTLKTRRFNNGVLMAYRQKEGKPSTSMVRAPKEMEFADAH